MLAASGAKYASDNCSEECPINDHLEKGGVVLNVVKGQDQFIQCQDVTVDENHELDVVFDDVKM